MKTIGLIGGMGWRASLEYYKIINELTQKKMGGWHSAKVLMCSVDFDEVDLESVAVQRKKTESILINAAKSLEQGGVSFIVICCNTAHILFDKIQKSVKIPVIHIADATAEKIKSAKIKKIGLLGTEFTVQKDFYKKRLKEKYGLEVIVPQEKEIKIVHQEIVNICLGKNSPKAKQRIVSVINNLAKRGAGGVILGCTELPLIVKQKDVKVRLFDTTKIHAEKAVEYSLK